MDMEDIVSRLKAGIVNEEEIKVKNIIGPIRDTGVIRSIDEKFYVANDIDPVNFAIRCGAESIAIYLVEKSFPTTRLTTRLSEPLFSPCDTWCLYYHGNDQCPVMCDACENAKMAGMKDLKNVIESRRQGNSKLEQIMEPVQQETEPVKQEKPSIQIFQLQKETAVDEAKKLLEDYGKNYVYKDGSTLFHCHITKPKVYFYVFAAGGVPVNIQNNQGDTALHSAVRAGSVDAVEALLQCCADPTIRNNLGQTPLEMSESDGITELLNKFKPGVVWSICNDKAQVLDRVLKNTWCCIDTVVKEGKTALEFAESKVYREGKSEKCVNVLKGYRKTSQLIHAVLCHDVETARKLLEREKLPVNIRFRDRLGKTLLSYVIEQHNLELVKLLVEHGARINQIRVREHEDTDVTVPLFHKCLCDNECQDIAKFLNPLMDPLEHKEKDQYGNTAVLAAIEKGLSVRFIQWLIQTTKGSALVDRNAAGLTPKGLAKKKNNTEVIKMIDKYIVQNVVQDTGVPPLLSQFATNFYEEEDFFGITDEKTKKTLVELLKGNEKLKLDKLKKWLDFKSVASHAEHIMKAASGNPGFVRDMDGGLTEVKKEYDANYRDKNGYTALTRAVVFQNYKVIEHLCTTRPILKMLPDNCNRYPLHYAFALPEPASTKVKNLLREKNAQEIEKRADKDGLYPADYATMKDSLKIHQMLHSARIKNVYAKDGAPYGRFPEGADRDPPPYEE